MIRWRNKLRECKRIPIELVVAVTLLGAEEQVSRWRSSQKEERPHGSGFLGRLSVLGAVDYLEGGMSSGTAGRCFQGEVLLGVPCCLSLRVSDEMGHLS